MTVAEVASPPTPPLRHGARVLLVRLSALGDVLFALETVAALAAARPDVAIEFLVEDRFAGLLAGHPHLAAVHVYPRRHKLRIVSSLLRLRRRRYDAILDLHGILKSALQVACLRSPRKIGLMPPGAREGSHRLYHRAVPVPARLPHRADLGYLLLRELGIEAEPTAPRLAAVPPPADLLAGLPRPLVLLHPGTSAFAAFKRWPPQRHGELARRLLARGLGVAVSHGPGENELGAEVAVLAPGVRSIDGSRLGLLGFAGLVAEVDVVVAADTGPLHIAAAAGRPCVALFGPKDPSRYGPRAHGGVRHTVLFADVPCRPCRRRDCATPQCVLGIDVDTVEAAVLRTLAEVRP